VTTIAINLLVEEELTQRAQSRDPFKIAVIIGGAVLALTLITGVILGQLAGRKTQEAATLQAKWDKMQAKQPSSSGADTGALRTIANDYLAVNKARPLYAPQLALVKDVIPDTIQLVAIRLGLVTETVVSSAPPAPGVSEAKAARAAKPKTVERMNLVLDGSATCARPEIEVDEFIKNLRVHPLFSKYVEDVRLRSITRVAGKTEAGGANLPSVSFSIDCVYRESNREAK